MIPGHVYPQLTTVRSAAYKRQCFESAWNQIKATDFEGGRPSRRALRDMALKRARLDAAALRAAQHEAVRLGAK